MTCMLGILGAAKQGNMHLPQARRNRQMCAPDPLQTPRTQAHAGQARLSSRVCQVRLRPCLHRWLPVSTSPPEFPAAYAPTPPSSAVHLRLCLPQCCLHMARARPNCQWKDSGPHRPLQQCSSLNRIESRVPAPCGPRCSKPRAPTGSTPPLAPCCSGLTSASPTALPGAWRGDDAGRAAGCRQRTLPSRVRPDTSCSKSVAQGCDRCSASNAGGSWSAGRSEMSGPKYTWCREVSSSRARWDAALLGNDADDGGVRAASADAIALQCDGLRASQKPRSYAAAARDLHCSLLSRVLRMAAPGLGRPLQGMGRVAASTSAMRSRSLSGASLRRQYLSGRVAEVKV